MPQEAPFEQQGPVKYCIFGCGTNGYNIILELAKEHERVIVADKDETRVRHLRDQKFDAYQRDITSSDMLAGLPQFEIAFVMTGDGDANLAAVLTIKKRYPRGADRCPLDRPGERPETDRGRCGFCPLPAGSGCTAGNPAGEKTAREPDLRSGSSPFSPAGRGPSGSSPTRTRTRTRSRLPWRLPRSQNRPTRKTLATRIFYEGNIGHQENRTFVNLLDIKMEHLTADALSKCTYLALVDCSEPGANNDVPPQTKINIIIDHHREAKHPATPGSFVDIRPGVGATASIMTQYLQELDIPVDKRVATALLYGIRTDTREFKRNVTPQDLSYAGFLLPLTDADLLDKIMSPSMSQETLDVIGKAIHERKIQSGYLFANVGYVMNRDALPQAADLLITLEGVNTALVYGITDNAIVISARNRDIRLHIGNALSEAFGDMGDAGGHPNMAAATLPLHYFGKVEDKARLLEIVIEPVLKKFRDLVGLENEGKKNGA